MFPIPFKYRIDHPFLTPEHLNINPDHKPKNKCLFIPDDDEPVVVHANYSEIIDEVFPLQPVAKLYFPNNYHMCLNEHIQYLSNNFENYVATQLFRIYSMQHNKEKESLTIRGNVLLFGSYREINGEYFLDDFSVPFEIVEQVFRLYETATKIFQA